MWLIPRQRVTGAVACGMALVVPLDLIPFGDAQKEVTQLSAEVTVIYHAQSKDPSTVMHHRELFLLQPNEHFVSYNAAIGVTIVVDTLMTHNMLSKLTKQKTHLVMQLAVPAHNLHLWTLAWTKAFPSSSGHCEGSKLFCGMRNFLLAFTTITEKKLILEAKETFHHVEGGYEMT